MGTIYAYLETPERIPQNFLPLELRNKKIDTPDVVLVEHGGDLIWGNTPSYLQNDLLMSAVHGIILCSESALAAMGAVHKLSEYGITNEKINIFVSVPLINPEGFFIRMESLLGDKIQGILDVTKPVLKNEREKRHYYSDHYDQILSCEDMVDLIGSKTTI